MAEIKTLTTKAQTEEAEFLAVLESHRTQARQMKAMINVYIEEGLREEQAWEIVRDAYWEQG